MNLRRRIADFISGGEISKLEAKFVDLRLRLESVISRPAVRRAIDKDILKSFVYAQVPESAPGPKPSVIPQDTSSDSDKPSEKEELLLGQITDLEAIIQEEKARADKFYKQYVEAQNKWVQVEELGRAGFRDRVVADFKSFAGEGVKLLWVQSSDPRCISQGTFAQIADIMKRVAPQIEAIVMTHGVVDLVGLKDEDLDRIGLRRIPDPEGKTVGGTIGGTEG